MKKILAFILAILTTLSLAACGSAEPATGTEQNATPTENNTQAAVQLDMPTVYETLQSKVTLPEMMTLNEIQMLNFCGIAAADVKQAVVVICADSLRTDEIWLVEAVDADAAARIKGLAEVRLDQKDAESITYSPEQNAVVKKAELICTGNYVALLVSPDSEALAQAYNELAQ